jgi:hypothetical protein
LNINEIAAILSRFGRMTVLRIIWVMNFFFFSLILLFVWSKIYIISKKVQAVASTAERVDVLTEQLDRPETAQPAKAATG